MEKYKKPEIKVILGNNDINISEIDESELEKFSCDPPCQGGEAGNGPC